MITIGVDFSKRTSHYCVLDSQGQPMKSCKIENRPELIKGFFEGLPSDEPRQLAMEATRSWGLYYETAKHYVDVFHLGHPKKMKVITHSEIKNDRKDAEAIARLLHSGFLPKAHITLLDRRQLKSLLRFRHFLVRQRVGIRNQIQTLLDRNLWPSQRPTSFKDIFCERGKKWLKVLPLPSIERLILDQCLAAHRSLSDQILKIEDDTKAHSADLPGIQHLKTVPGFKRSRVNLYTVILETDDIRRFRKARHFAHYAGLVPREHSSGDKHHTGHLVKDANSFLRQAILESVFGALKTDRALRAYYQSVKERRGSGAAIVASSRKLCYAIYHVLKEQRAYRPFQNPPVAAMAASSA